MSDEHMDDILRELQGDLNAVRPSPEFAAKVRQRIATQPVRRWFGAWRLVGATAAVASVVATVMVVRDRNRAADVPATPVVASTNATAPQPEAAPPDRQRPHVAPVQMARVRASRVAERPVSGPEVLVPPDQAMAIARFLDRLKAGHAGHVPKGVDLIDESTGEVNVPKLVEIQPIVIDLLPGSADARGGGRDR